MVEKLHKARKIMFIMMGYLEFLVGILILIGIIIDLTDILQFMDVIHSGGSGGFSEYLKYLFDVLIGIELIKLLCRNDLYSMVEVLLFAVTRHLIMEHLTTLEILIGILAIVALFSIRKFLFIHKETYEQERHRREYMD